MSFFKPKSEEMYRSFARAVPITERYVPRPPHQRHEKRMHRTNMWPGEQLKYDYLERCKEVVCRVKHPTGYFQQKGAEYRVSIVSWSRGSYLDIRMYKMGQGTPMGILLHLDIISEILPEIINAVKRMQDEDTREPEKKAKIEVIRA